MSTDYFRLDLSAKPQTADHISHRMQWLVFLLGVLLVFSRRPDAFLHPVFFAEDGTIWYAEAYRLGFLKSIFLPEAGYLLILPRLVATWTLLVPLLYAPLLMNLVGTVIQVLPVNLLLSRRCVSWGSLPVRLIMSFAYLAIPNSRELDVVLTNSQWHLALLACLVVLASVPHGRKWKAFDIGILVLSGLTGPFCLLLFPVAVAMWWFRRANWRLIPIAIVLICGLLQLSVLFGSGFAIRTKAPLGASIRLLIDLIAGHVYLAAILGQSNYTAGVQFVVLCLVAVLGTAVILYCLLKGRLELRLFVVFSLLVFAASLKSPLMSDTSPQWQVLDQAYGIRYWFFPMLAFVWCLIWCCSASSSLVSISAGGTLVLMLSGVARDWVYPSFGNRYFPRYAEEFAAAPPGTIVTIPIFPDGWKLRLTKASPSCAGKTLSGFIDSPAANSKVAGSFLASGWAFGSAPIDQVTLLIDGSRVGSTKPDLVRADVDQIYPKSPAKQKGWQMQISVPDLKPGTHEIEMQAREPGGCVEQVAATTIESIP